jgi:hypothetical protein
MENIMRHCGAVEEERKKGSTRTFECEARGALGRRGNLSFVDVCLERDELWRFDRPATAGLLARRNGKDWPGEES